MGKSLSVLKSDRVNKRKKAMNLHYKEKIRQIYRLIKKAIKENNKSEIQEHHKVYISLIDKAVKKSIYHKNKGSRKKSKMNLKVKNFVLGS